MPPLSYQQSVLFPTTTVPPKPSPHRFNCLNLNPTRSGKPPLIGCFCNSHTVSTQGPLTSFFQSFPPHALGGWSLLSCHYATSLLNLSLFKDVSVILDENVDLDLSPAFHSLLVDDFYRLPADVWCTNLLPRNRSSILESHYEN